MRYSSRKEVDGEEKDTATGSYITSSSVMWASSISISTSTLSVNLYKTYH